MARASGRGGGGYGGAVGAGVDASSSSSSRSGGTSGRGGGGYSGAVGHGVDSAHGGSSSVDSGGNVSGLGTGSSSNTSTSRGASRADQSSRRGPAVSDDAISAARTVAGAKPGGITSGMVASFADEAESSFMDRADLQADPSAGFSAQADLQAMPQAERRSRAEQSIAQNASPGVVGNITSMAAGLLNPLAAPVVSTTARALDAQRDTKAHNTKFGMDLDTSLTSHLGSQAKGTVAGAIGNKVGGQAGASIGASAGGVPGAVVGGLLGSGVLGNKMRDVAMSPTDTNEQSDQQGPARAPTGNGGSGGLLASRTPRTANPQAPTSQAAAPNYGPSDFKGYGSYAESFFA